MIMLISHGFLTQHWLPRSLAMLLSCLFVGFLWASWGDVLTFLSLEMGFALFLFLWLLILFLYRPRPMRELKMLGFTCPSWQFSSSCSLCKFSSYTALGNSFVATHTNVSPLR